MRALAILCSVVTFVFAGLWILGYLYISAMGCAFSHNRECGPPAPWSLSGEDLIFMLLMPGAIFLALLGLTLWLWRKV